jgi:hypothetical protein
MIGFWVFFAPGDFEHPAAKKAVVSLFCFFLAGMATWVAVYGAGYKKCMSDDRRVHKERKKRYGWRW